MNLKSVFLLGLLFTLLVGCEENKSVGQNIHTRGTVLPLNIPGDRSAQLNSMEDPRLSEKLNALIRQQPGWSELVNAGKMSVGLVDLSDTQNMRFAQVNGDVMMYAASLPKIAILLASMDAMESGELPDNAEIRADLYRMISFSDNQASTRMIDRLGYNKIESVLTDPRYQLYDQSHGGGLWVGKRYAAGGARHPEPMQGLSHAATATQVCRFYYMLATGNLVSRERSAQMLEIMVNPSLHHKFVHSLDQLAPNAQVYRKSGSWQAWHCDSALVWDNSWRRYILVALVEDPSGEQIIREIVPIAERCINPAQ
ncbi:MAG: class A beta-lactamase-related serine hydrolase [Bacteroidia bacterium]|nr:class A beta-lactamase-related serine hydrolase [Bacteroidia bacterium]